MKDYRWKFIEEREMENRIVTRKLEEMSKLLVASFFSGSDNSTITREQ